MKINKDYLKVMREGKKREKEIDKCFENETSGVGWVFFAVLIIVALMLLFCGPSYAQETPFTDENCIRAVIGEASNQGYRGLLDLASGIRNRGHLGGVYGVKAKHVDREPEWVWKMARKAWKESEYNRTHTGTHWENIKAFGTPYWVKSMKKVHEYKDHVFYEEKS